MKRSLILLIIFLVLSGCNLSNSNKVLSCDGDFDRTISGKTELKIKGSLSATVTKKNLIIEGSFFDDTYEICNETDTTIWFEKSCTKKKESDFKTSKEFVHYLLYTNSGGGLLSKTSGYLEITNLPPLGLNETNSRSFTGQFNCKKGENIL